MQTVLVVTEKVLPISVTFIRAQVAALTKFHAQYVGLIPSVPSLSLPQKPILLCSRYSAFNRCRKILYRWTGMAPAFHRRVREAGGTLIHAHFGENGPIALSLAKTLNLPLIMHLRGGAEIMDENALRFRSWALPFLIHKRELCQRASVFLCVSDFIRRIAIEKGFPKEKLRVQYTGINLDLFKPIDQARDKDTVLYVGRLVEYKGGMDLVRAMAMVREKQPSARLVMIGDGPLRPRLEQLSTELKVPCLFLGGQPQDEIRKWLSKARVFCAPSLTLPDGQAEAFGNVFTEAQAMGLPVVSYKHGGIPEAVSDGQTGLLADEKDAPTLAAHIQRFLTDDAFWNSCHQKGISWTRENFNIVTQTARLERIYEDVLTQSSARRNNSL
jgi:colanic acid/amylovoran biosynthesis glycosyltransferase